MRPSRKNGYGSESDPKKNPDPTNKIYPLDINIHIHKLSYFWSINIDEKLDFRGTLNLDMQTGYGSDLFKNTDPLRFFY